MLVQVDWGQDEELTVNYIQIALVVRINYGRNVLAIRMVPRGLYLRGIFVGLDR